MEGDERQHWRNSDLGSSDPIYYRVTLDKAFKLPKSKTPLLFFLFFFYFILFLNFT